MKKTVFRIIEGMVLFFMLGYLSTLGIGVFFKLIQLLPVEFITYKPTRLIDLFQTAVWSSIAIAPMAIVIEWKREKRKVSYLIYLVYLSAPFIASLVLFLITAWYINRIDPIFLEHMGGQVPTGEIPMKLIFIGYIAFPITHLILTRIKGRSSRVTQ
jgi:hypothetical protein